MKGNIEKIFNKIKLKIIELRKNKALLLELSENKELFEGEEYKILFEGLRGLIVEDDKINSIVMSEYLEYLGVLTDTAFCTDELLEKIEKNRYDIIFLDMHINDTEIINIFDVLKKKIKAKSYVIACTVKIEKEFKRRCFEVGIDGFIEKPVIMKKIVIELKNNFKFNYKQEKIEKINNNEIIEKMKEIFVESYPKEMREMRVEIEMEFFEKAEKRTHRLKSGAGDLKESILYNYLSKLEENLRKKENNEIFIMLKKVEIEVERIVNSYIG